jgi:hypothetical protein
MITQNMALVFIVVVFGLFWYIFRGLGNEQNPKWGNFLAVGLGIVLCGFVGYAFFSGGIGTVTVVNNATYQVDYTTLTPAEIASISANATARQYILESGGVGMYSIAAVDNPVLSSSLGKFTVQYYSHDIIYTQNQDRILALLFFVLCAINVVIGVYFFYQTFLVGDEGEDGEGGMNDPLLDTVGNNI